jgi:hypothetical protein
MANEMIRRQINFIPTGLYDWGLRYATGLRGIVLHMYSCKGIPVCAPQCGCGGARPSNWFVVWSRGRARGVSASDMQPAAAAHDPKPMAAAEPHQMTPAAGVEPERQPGQQEQHEQQGPLKHLQLAAVANEDGHVSNRRCCAGAAGPCAVPPSKAAHLCTACESPSALRRHARAPLCPRLRGWGRGCAEPLGPAGTPPIKNGQRLPSLWCCCCAAHLRR